MIKLQKQVSKVIYAQTEKKKKSALNMVEFRKQEEITFIVDRIIHAFASAFNRTMAYFGALAWL